MDRLQNLLNKYGLWQETHKQRIRMILGELSNPLFGLELNEFDQLSDSVDAIYHFGADVNLIKPYSDLKSVDVLGTQDVIHFAAASSPPVPVHYMSTLSVFDSLVNFDVESGQQKDGQMKERFTEEQIIHCPAGYCEAIHERGKLLWQAYRVQQRSGPVRAKRASRTEMYLPPVPSSCE